MNRWLRRLFRRPPTIADCIRAARTAPCEPLRAPDPTRGDPYAGVVTGPQLVDRTRWITAQHHARYRNDTGFPVTFGPFVNPYDEGDAA